VAPKIEGLLRISELSWTKRIKHPSDIVSVDQEIEVEILSANAAKHQLALGYKQVLPNPWLTIAESLPVGTETTGVVQQTTAQGAVVRINDTFDGFMPRSKMVNAGRGKKVELNAGDEIPCVVVDLNPAAASLILAMKNEDGTIAGSGDADRSEGGYREGGYREGGQREGGRRERDRSHEGSSHHEHAPTGAAVTLGDMLRDLDKSKLNG
jgi:small subunit ribosomal protein S1